MNAGAHFFLLCSLPCLLIFFIFPLTVQYFPDSQAEINMATKTDRTEEKWESAILPDNGDMNESWEEQVEDLVTWTNTLDTKVLDD